MARSGKPVRWAARWVAREDQQHSSLTPVEVCTSAPVERRGLDAVWEFVIGGALCLAGFASARIMGVRALMPKFEFGGDGA